MPIEYIKKKRNPLVVSGLVGILFVAIHSVITLIAGKFNIIYSLIGGAVLFALYFIFQAAQNIRIHKMQKKIIETIQIKYSIIQF
ncbi:MAG: hypothetical protein ABII01_04475 [Candidatus Woesearchaeota archaeon]